jgi:hypothetical protein
VSYGPGNMVDENCALLGYYAESSGNFLPAFQDKLSAPSSGGGGWGSPMKMGL